MRKLYEIIDRANRGPFMTEEQWDLEQVAMTTMRLVEKYKLAWNPARIIPEDAGLADAIFDAGFELAKTLGVYFRDTRRVIQFEPGELEVGIRIMPKTLSMGEGKDERTFVVRAVQDTRPPLIWSGNAGAPIPERYYLEYVMVYAQEPIVDLFNPGSLTSVDGFEVRTGGPMEIAVCRREMEYVRTGTRRVGRPGMPVLAAASAVSALGDVAVAHPNYMRPSDAHLVPMLNELKMDSGNFGRAVNAIEYGVRNASLPCVSVGGLGGDAPGSAVINVASFLLSNLVCLSDFHICHPIHIRHIATSTRAVMWVESVVGQAFARNAPCIVVADIFPKSGAMTRELLYETAANAIVITLSAAHLEGPSAADGAAPNCSGLEARLMGEVGHAVASQGLTQDQGNTMVLRLLEKYEHIFARPGGNPGLPLDQVYNLETLTPIPEWQAMYDEVKSELRALGLEALPAG